MRISFLEKTRLESHEREFPMSTVWVSFGCCGGGHFLEVCMRRGSGVEARRLVKKSSLAQVVCDLFL